MICEISSTAWMFIAEIGAFALIAWAVAWGNRPPKPTIINNHGNASPTHTNAWDKLNSLTKFIAAIAGLLLAAGTTYKLFHM